MLSDGAFCFSVVLSNMQHVFHWRRVTSFGNVQSSEAALSALKTSLVKNRAGAWVSPRRAGSTLPDDVTMPSAMEGDLWPNFTLAYSGMVPDPQHCAASRQVQ